MNKQIALKLRDKITELEQQFSNPNRDCNHNQETFKCNDITPLSDSVAMVTLQKNTGKECTALFFYIKDYWIYFFPTDSHELGMYYYLSNNYRTHLENFNFDKNFMIGERKRELKTTMININDTHA